MQQGMIGYGLTAGFLAMLAGAGTAAAGGLEGAEPMVAPFAALLGLTAFASIFAGMLLGRRLRATANAATAPTKEQVQRLAELSHGLRTPLNSVMGFSEIMRDELYGPLGNPRYRDYAAHIKDDAQVLLARLDDLIEVAGQGSGRQPMPLERRAA